MNLGSYLQLGNMLKGVYDANQQSLVNQQNQQRINDLLANDALMRQIDSQKFQDYLDALNSAGAYWRTLGANQNSAAAPVPGQNSAQQPNPPVATPIPGATPIPPLPPNITAQSAPVSNPAQDIQEVSLPAAPTTPTFGPRQQFSGISTPDQVVASLKAKKISPNAAVSILSDMAKRGGSPSAASPADVPPAQQKQDASTELPVGTYGRVLAMVQNNLPIKLAAQAAANLLKTNPDMSDRELALAMNAIDPMLTRQSDNALRLAGLSNTEMFKVLNLEMQRLRLGVQYPNLADGESPYTPEQLTYAADMISNGMGNLVPAKMRNWAIAMTPNLASAARNGKIQLEADAAREKTQVLATLASGGSGAGGGGTGVATNAPQTPSANSSTPNLSGVQQQVIQSWINGKPLPSNGYLGIAARQTEADMEQQLGLAPGAIPAIGAQQKSSQSTATQLQNRYAQFQTSAKALEGNFAQIQDLAKQLQLNGIATVNKGRLLINRKLAPTGSAQGQLVAQYDALVNEMQREYGVVTGFGKMTGYAFKSASDVFNPNQGVAIDGVSKAVQFGANQAENAFQNTLQYIQNLPQSKLIESAKNKKLAAQYVGFRLMDSKTFAAYAKQHFNGSTNAARQYLIAHNIQPE